MGKGGKQVCTNKMKTFPKMGIDFDNSITETLEPIKEKDRDSFGELAWVHQSVLEY